LGFSGHAAGKLTVNADKIEQDLRNPRVDPEGKISENGA
jgi:hypothetical protein